jgi:hypothetical protein
MNPVKQIFFIYLNKSYNKKADRIAPTSHNKTSFKKLKNYASLFKVFLVGAKGFIAIVCKNIAEPIAPKIACNNSLRLKPPPKNKEVATIGKAAKAILIAFWFCALAAQAFTAGI